jgi:hypothetical protein
MMRVAVLCPVLAVKYNTAAVGESSAWRLGAEGGKNGTICTETGYARNSHALLLRNLNVGEMAA